MTDKQRTQLVRDIKRMERELHAKRSRLAVAGQQRMGGVISGRPSDRALAEKRRRDLLRLVERIGASSAGGNSVEDIRRERERCK